MQLRWRVTPTAPTTIEFNTAVKIEGQSLPAVRYGFLWRMIPRVHPDFSKNSGSWGIFIIMIKKMRLC
ncbi:MAG: DUF2911 domain-containing protein [Chitinophagaceae bacterium]|nr:DUF2911 domain-containing protein [Chitinophagaceae bacterium]